MDKPLIRIKNLTVDYASGGFLKGSTRSVRALNSVSLEIAPGITFGIVGESGCGKTTLGRALLRLVEPTEGEIVFDGEDWLSLNQKALRGKRRNMQIIFQNPTSSLDPRMKIFNLIAEPLRAQTDLRGEPLKARVAELLIMVDLQEDQMDRRPRELSGGQAQRVAIARSLALSPKFLVLDEPTSALDVSVQAQIINLLVRLQNEKGLTYLFISHDLPVVQYISQWLAVMYVGEIVEMSPANFIFRNALHPYTQALLSATPQPVPGSKRKRIVLEGNVPSPANPPSGCTFHTRCPLVFERCPKEKPKLVQVSEEHWAACHLVGEGQFPSS
ncbi:MAG: ABC transporter ATP-binding protein [Anaerolineales bacterium]|nr:MAG: ABC transporter ATP-binding protein [Anaerolineales bacterium]